jgi:hypothetical protein
MGTNRRPTKQEERLVEVLVIKSGIDFPIGWKDNLLVSQMDDGGMGSLYLFPEGLNKEQRSFGKQISELQFTDIDGVEVIASLNLDESGNLFELDIWKTDFGKLLKLPDL